MSGLWEKYRNYMDKHWINYSIVIFFLIYLLSIANIVQWADTDFKESFKNANQLGDFLSGIFAPMAFLLAGFAFLKQNQSQKDTEDFLEKQAQAMEKQATALEKQLFITQQQYAAYLEDMENSKPYFDLSSYLQYSDTPYDINEVNNSLYISCKIYNKGAKATITDEIKVNYSNFPLNLDFFDEESREVMEGYYKGGNFVYISFYPMSDNQTLYGSKQYQIEINIMFFTLNTFGKYIEFLSKNGDHEAIAFINSGLYKNSYTIPLFILRKLKLHIFYSYENTSNSGSDYYTFTGKEYEAISLKRLSKNNVENPNS